MHIVFLHGFLGTPQEFMPIAFRLPFKSEMITLPSHGCSDAIVDFSNVNEWLEEELKSLKIKDYILYGYSLGGRITLHYALSNNIKFKPKGVIIESANIGLNDTNLKKERLKNDKIWQQKFLSLPMNEVLTDWYNQEIFADLSEEDKNYLINKRAKNDPTRMANILMNLSLAKMPFLGEKLKESSIPMMYIYGLLDNKAQKISQKIIGYKNPNIQVEAVDNVGHNCHLKDASTISSLINNFYQNLESK